MLCMACRQKSPAEAWFIVASASALRIVIPRRQLSYDAALRACPQCGTVRSTSPQVWHFSPENKGAKE